MQNFKNIVDQLNHSTPYWISALFNPFADVTTTMPNPFSDGTPAFKSILGIIDHYWEQEGVWWQRMD